MANLAWAVSGQGRALQAVMEACGNGILKSSVKLVIVDRPSPIEAVADAVGIKCARILPEKGKADDFQKRVREALLSHEVDWLGMTFNRILAPSVLDALAGRVFNLHLAILPAFRGLSPIRQALDAGVRIAGATVHVADPGVDTGPILAQAACPVLDGDTEATLGRRLFEAALPIVLQVVRSIERNDLRLEGANPIWLQQQARFVGAYPHPEEDLISFSAQFCKKL